MSTDSLPEVPEPRKRPGRKPGKAKRPDPDAAPIDGDYAPLDIVNKAAGYGYVALSANDMRKRGHQFEQERWSPTCAHAPYEQFSEDKKGQPVLVNGQLFLCRAPKERIEARKQRELKEHRARTGALIKDDEGRGHTPSQRTINTHNLRVN